LDQVDASDAKLDHAHAAGERAGEQPVGDDDTEAIVAAQDIADASDEDVHPAYDRRRGHMHDAVQALRERVARYPADRYPVQHATAQFHLGAHLAHVGRTEEAELSLRAAASLFDPRWLPAEHAKALNALGAALRAQGRLEEASHVLSRAADVFSAHDQHLEEGAARFNHGVVRRELGLPDDAVAELDRARALLDAARVPVQAAAARRELAAALLERGDAASAAAASADALTLSERCGDRMGAGAAANVLGLAHLAVGREDAAIAAFRTAVAAHPRTVRPAEFAMAKANLALAHERAGDAPRARLAARQALAVVEAPAAVRAQASAITARRGPGVVGDLLTVLDDEPAERRSVVLREELTRWADADEGERRAEVAAWIDGLLARPVAALELAEAWVGVLLELPPDAMERLIGATVESLAHRAREDRDRFRADVSMAMARFPVPQLLRLKDSFDRVARGRGEEPAWG